MLSSVRRDFMRSMQFAHIGHLCLVFEDGFDLGVPGVGDIHRDVGLAGQRAPNFLWHVRLKAFLEKFGEINKIPRGGENSVQDDLSAGAMVGMVDAILGKQILRVAGDEDVGLVPADLAHHVAAQVKAWDEVSICEVEKMNCLRRR